MSVMEVHGVTNEITLAENERTIHVSAPGCKLSPEQARHVARKLYRLARNIEKRLGVAQ